MTQVPSMEVARAPCMTNVPPLMTAIHGNNDPTVTLIHIGVSEDLLQSNKIYRCLITQIFLQRGQRPTPATRSKEINDMLKNAVATHRRACKENTRWLLETCPFIEKERNRRSLPYEEKDNYCCISWT